MLRMPQPFILRLLLILALLFTQLGGLTHGIAHLLADQAQDQSQPHDKQCDLCAAYAQIGSAVGSTEVRVDIAASVSTTPTPYSPAFRSTAFAAFAARAPPRSV
ncbi:MAG: hypothetical protein Fur0026_08520 [Sideroxydans sp.]